MDGRAWRRHRRSIASLDNCYSIDDERVLAFPFTGRRTLDLVYPTGMAAMRHAERRAAARPYQFRDDGLGMNRS